MNDVNVKELIQFYDTIHRELKEVTQNTAAAKETSALAVQKIVELENAFYDFRNDMIVYREVRNRIDIDELENQMSMMGKKLGTIKSSGSTQDKIDKAVEVAIKKKGIDWVSMFRNNVLPGVMTTISIVVVLALLAPLVRDWIVPALLSAFSGK